jgi:predicted molibdopterin-dependent oxidoreductase YjgC
VEVEKARTLLAACATPAGAGMVVQTESPKVIEARRQIIQLMLSSGNHNCAVRGSDDAEWTAFQLKVQVEDGSDALCPVWGDCRLQDLAYRYQVSGEAFPATPTQYPMETVNPFIVRDFFALHLLRKMRSGLQRSAGQQRHQLRLSRCESKIIAAGDRPLKDSDCVFCGECVQVCPVGALVEKDQRYAVRPWETHKVRTTCSYCGVGCQIDLHVKDERCRQGDRCGFSTQLWQPVCQGAIRLRLHQFGRAPHCSADPGKWDAPGGFLGRGPRSGRDAGWAKFVSAYGGDAIGMLTSARVTNEENYIAQKFTRAVLKTNNIDHCARL